MIKYICMTNGGSYGSVSHINGDNVDNMSNSEIVSIVTSNEFINIDFESNKEAIIRTSCISSINI